MTQQEIQSALAAPFPADAVGWKAQAVTKDQSKALAVAYIDARCVIDRLNAVVGLAGWQDAYDLLPDGCVVCHLSLRIDGGWVTKVDVGGESDQPNGGDKRKAAFSDALKRRRGQVRRRPLPVRASRRLVRLRPQAEAAEPDARPARMGAAAAGGGGCRARQATRRRAGQAGPGQRPAFAGGRKGAAGPPEQTRATAGGRGPV